MLIYQENFFGYGAIKQLKDILPVILATIGMAIIITVIMTCTAILVMQLILSGIFGALTYLGICHLLKLQELYELWELLLKFKLKLMGSKEMEYKSVSYFPKSSSTFE
jgi:hypothetical protein